jgi:predicted lipoprotein with Yx(FWY)xxD motif
MKSVWTIVIVIVVIAVVGFGGYKVWHHFNKQTSPTPQAMMQTQSMKPKPSSMVMMTKNNVDMMMPAGKLGNILTDPKGMTLYTYTKDTTGVSNCNGGCLKAWPAYVASSEMGTFPANISVIKRSDGTHQYAWKGMPLYYFASDTKPGDTTGQGVGGVWFVVK